MKMKATAAAVLLAVCLALPAFATPALAALNTGLTVPVAASNTLGAFTGTLNIKKFVVQDGALAAVGVLTGVVTNAAGGVVGTVLQTVTLPVAVQQAACDILTLDLGPLHLDLLGLVIDLSAIHLDITAQPGPGNLLGNLLCAVAGLLDRPALAGVAALLNQILAILG